MSVSRLFIALGISRFRTMCVSRFRAMSVSRFVAMSVIFSQLLFSRRLWLREKASDKQCADHGAGNDDDQCEYASNDQDNGFLGLCGGFIPRRCRWRCCCCLSHGTPLCNDSISLLPGCAVMPICLIRYPFASTMSLRPRLTPLPGL